MKGKIVITHVVIAILLMLLSGCFSFENGEKPPADHTKVTLKADLSRVMTRAVGDYYVVYVDLTDESHPIVHERIDSSELTLTLEKGHVYVVGVFKQADEGILPVGLIGSEDAGLSSLPITNDATDVIDLGTLEATNGILSTAITPEKFAEMLGFVDEEAIRQFGGYDITLKNLLNPDIDRNGVFDDEEGIRWYVEPSYDFVVLDNDYFENPDVPGKYLVGLGLCIFITHKGHYFEYAVYKDTGYATLTLPNNKPLTAFHSGGDEKEGGNMFCFDVGENGKNTRILSGDYTLTLHDKYTDKDVAYHFTWDFLDPNSQYGGFLFPLQKILATSDGVYEKLFLKWKLFKKDGSINEIDDELIGLIGRRYKIYNWEMVADIPKLTFDLGDLEKVGDHWELDFSKYDQIYRWQVESYQMKIARFEFQDIGNNVINVRAPIVHRVKPYGYEKLVWKKLPSSFSLSGIWFNHGYIWDEGNWSVLVFQPDGTLLAFQNWDNFKSVQPIPDATYEYEITNDVLYLTNDEGSESIEIEFAESEDGRKFIKLISENGEMIFDNFYSYVNAFGNIVERYWGDYTKLTSVHIESFENNVVRWTIDWDGNYDYGIVGFDFYVGKDPSKMNLIYFQYQDNSHVPDKRFELDLSKWIEPGKYYLKIVGNSWKEIVESNVVEIEVK